MSGWFRNVKTKTPQMRRLPATVMPSMWFCPAPGATDLDAVFSEDGLNYLAPYVDVYPFFMSHLLEGLSGTTQHGQNNRAKFESLGALPKLKSRAIRTAVETAAVKVQQDPFSSLAVDILNSAVALGGDVPMLVMDEPFCAGLKDYTPPLTMQECADRVAAFIREVTTAHGPQHIILCEPYPSLTANEILEGLRLLDVVGSRPLGLHLDVDWNAVRGRIRDGRASDVRLELRRLVRTTEQVFDIPVGLLVWGFDDDSDANFCRSAKELVGFYQDTFGSDFPERLIIESWSGPNDGARTRPRTMPLEGPDTLASLLREIVEAVVPVGQVA